jgi:hypothetical protein
MHILLLIFLGIGMIGFLSIVGEGDFFLGAVRVIGWGIVLCGVLIALAVHNQ